MDQEPLLPSLIATLSEAGLYKQRPAIEAHARKAFFERRPLAVTPAETLLIEAMFSIVKTKNTDGLKPLLDALEYIVNTYEAG